MCLLSLWLLLCLAHSAPKSSKNQPDSQKSRNNNTFPFKQTVDALSLLSVRYATAKCTRYTLYNTQCNFAVVRATYSLEWFAFQWLNDVGAVVQSKALSRQMYTFYIQWVISYFTQITRTNLTDELRICNFKYTYQNMLQL